MTNRASNTSAASVNANAVRRNIAEALRAARQKEITMQIVRVNHGAAAAAGCPYACKAYRAALS